MGRRIALVNLDYVDNPEGIILGGGQSLVSFNGLAIAVVGDRVHDHNQGSHRHTNVVMATGSNFMSIEGKPVCREGDLASCNEPCTGSAFMTTD